MTQAAEKSRTENAVTHEIDGAYTKIFLPEELQFRQDIYSPVDHETVLFTALIVGWCYYKGMPIKAYYKRRETSDRRYASVRGKNSMIYLVEEED